MVLRQGAEGGLLRRGLTRAFFSPKCASWGAVKERHAEVGRNTGVCLDDFGDVAGS